MGTKALVDDRGRLPIPSEIRKELGFCEGDSVIIEIVGPGEFRVIRLKPAADRARGMYRLLRGPGENVSDELIADRRREASRSEPRHE